jgi:hypothetical protein
MLEKIPLSMYFNRVDTSTQIDHDSPRTEHTTMNGAKQCIGRGAVFFIKILAIYT